MSAITFLPRLKQDLDDPVGVPEVWPVNLRSSYDFIVVGAGSTGAVVASRLAQWTSASVLLLEAGEDGTLLSNIPAAVGATLGSEYDWQYLTNPSKYYCRGMKKNQCLWHAGKVLGGGSTINGMLYVRGVREDYDSWEEAGNPGWGWNSVLKYFLRSEDQTKPEYARNTAYHRVGGPLTVSDIAFNTPLKDAFLAAAQYAGYKITDINAGNENGFTFMQATIKDGRRVSTANAFIRPVVGRKNFDVLTQAHVEKILIDDRSKRAYGVVINRRGERRTVMAYKDIVVSAGVIGSPKLLMLSGIGPANHLNSLGIKVIEDLPVGQNMQSHVGTGEIAFTLEQPVSFNPLRVFSNPLNLLAYLRGEGPLASVSGFEGTGFIKTGINSENSWPDLQVNLITATPGVDGGLVYRRSLNMKDEMFRKWSPLAFQEAFNILPYILHPKSRGTVHLKTKNPKDFPIITPNYFKHPDDIKMLVEGVKFSIKLGQSAPFKKFGSKFYDRPIEECLKFKPYSDSYWECAVRYFTYPLYHDVGTCRMAPRENEGVVDARLRVHGISGLRVADASIMPNLVSGNTNAACIMIGEKVVDLIIQDWNLSYAG